MTNERIQRLHKFMKDFKKFMRDNYYDIYDKDIQGYLRGLVQFNVNESKERTMDYEKKYKEAFSRAKKLKGTCDSTAVVGWCEYIFPELKENEDERMAKHIIDIVKCKGYDAAKDENFYAAEIAWLEKQGEHRTAWSEDDERMFKNTIALIETLEDYNKAPDGFGDVKFWLKSLKERYTWKPSEEQINALDSTLHYSQVSHNSFENLNSLFNDLKKLK